MGREYFEKKLKLRGPRVIRNIPPKVVQIGSVVEEYDGSIRRFHLHMCRCAGCIKGYFIKFQIFLLSESNAVEKIVLPVDDTKSEIQANPKICMTMHNIWYD